MSELILSDDKTRLDVTRVHGWLASSYWSPGIERALVERAIAGSHVLGAYHGDEQVGYDVFVDESSRGRGIGKALVGWFLGDARFAGIRRIGLVTADAHGVYAALGFHALLRPERYMERLAPGFADMLRTAP